MVRSLDRGIKILEILSENAEMGITEMAEVLEVDKSTVSRLMETLRSHDMVQMNKRTKKYRLGLRLLNLGTAAERNLNIIEIARPVIRSVSDKLEQSVHLCAYNNMMAYVIDQTVYRVAFSVSATIGMIEPIHASSVGKCILAYRPEDMLDQILEGYDYVKYTEKTILDKEHLLKELRKIKEQGYSIDNEEVSVGVRCVAVPVFSYRNKVRYSIGISGPVGLMTDENVRLYVSQLRNAARKISKELGHQYS